MKLPVGYFQKRLDEIVKCEVFVLKKSKPVYHYENGTKTEKIEFYKYEVANPDTYDLYEIKVPSTKPVISQEDLEKSENVVWISFKNAILKPYRIEFGKVECSVVAESATIVENE